VGHGLSVSLGRSVCGCHIEPAERSISTVRPMLGENRVFLRMFFPKSLLKTTRS
jgi:hypothetical protein